MRSFQKTGGLDITNYINDSTPFAFSLELQEI